MEKGKISFENESESFIEKDGRAHSLNNQGFPLKRIVEKKGKLHVLECGHSLSFVGTHSPRWRRCPNCAGHENGLSLSANPFVKQSCPNCQTLQAEIERLKAWTLVENGLPEKNGFYLITALDQSSGRNKVFYAQYFYKAFWLIPGKFNNELKYWTVDAIAWRNLPEAYQK